MFAPDKFVKHNLSYDSCCGLAVKRDMKKVKDPGQIKKNPLSFTGLKLTHSLGHCWVLRPGRLRPDKQILV